MSKRLSHGLLLVLAACAAAPKARRADKPFSLELVVLTPERRLVVRDAERGAERLVLPELAGAVVDARLNAAGAPVVLSCVTLEGGRECSVGLYGIDASGSEATSVLGVGDYTELLAVDGSGQLALAARSLGSSRVAVDLLTAGSPPRQLAEFRVVWASSIRADGKEALVGGIDGACKYSDVRQCRIVALRISLTAADSAPVELAPELCVAYQPSYGAHDEREVFFQGSFGRGPECVGDTNFIPLSILRAGSSGTRVLRERAVGPSLSPDGELVAWLRYPAGCDHTPCGAYDVEVAPLDDLGALRRVGSGAAINSQYFSRDGRRLAISSVNPEHPLNWTAARIDVVTLTGELTRLPLGLGKVIGWR